MAWASEPPPREGGWGWEGGGGGDDDDDLGGAEVMGGEVQEGVEVRSTQPARVPWGCSHLLTMASRLRPTSSLCPLYHDKGAVELRAYVSNLAVAPDCRRLGVGRLLMGCCETEVGRVGS